MRVKEYIFEDKLGGFSRYVVSFWSYSFGDVSFPNIELVRYNSEDNRLGLTKEDKEALQNQEVNLLNLYDRLDGLTEKEYFNFAFCGELARLTDCEIPVKLEELENYPGLVLLDILATELIPMYFDALNDEIFESTPNDLSYYIGMMF